MEEKTDHGLVSVKTEREDSGARQEEALPEITDDQDADSGAKSDSEVTIEKESDEDGTYSVNNIL